MMVNGAILLTLHCPVILSSSLSLKYNSSLGFTTLQPYNGEQRCSVSFVLSSFASPKACLFLGRLMALLKYTCLSLTQLPEEDLSAFQTCHGHKLS